MRRNDLQNFEKLRPAWVITTLGKVLPISYGKGLTKANRVESGAYPVYGSSGQLGWHSESLTKKPALIIGRKGSIGQVYYSSSPCWPIDTTYYVEEGEGLYLPFFHHLLKGIRLGELDKSTAVPGLSRDDYDAVDVAIAPLTEQKRIVAEIEKQFSRLDEAVAGLKRVKANLKRYKAAVLKAAVEGRLTERWRKEHPNVEHAEKLLYRILTERRKKWEQAELAKMGARGIEPKDDEWKEKYRNPKPVDYENYPSLPYGWHWASTDQLFWFVTSGSRGWAKYYSESGAFFLRIGNLDHDSITLDLKDRQRVRPPEGAEGTRTRVEPKDILISITADVGMIAVVPEEFEEAFINQHIALAKPVSNVESAYIAWYLCSRPGQKQLHKLQRGATKTGLGLDDIRSVNIPLPPLEEQSAIISQVEQRLSIADEIDKGLNANLRRAERLRQSILKKAFSGQLVPQAAKGDIVSIQASSSGSSSDA
ncbi:MAG: restriction endonuclease subunit S [Deltaproteobacteria bacterium]